MIKANVHGNLGSDSELKVSKSGSTSFLTFSIASTTGENTTWVNCVIFDPKEIEFNKDKLVKGARVQVYGNLKMTTTDKGSRLEMVVKDVVSVYVKEGAAKSAPNTAKVRAGVKAPVNEDAEDEDVPFLSTIS